MLERKVVVERLEMLSRDLDVLQDPLADRHARDNDDELLEAVAARELEERAQIDVGLTSACLHFDREMRTGPGGIGRTVEEIPGLERQGRVGQFDIVAGLNSTGVGKQRVVREQHVVADAKLRLPLLGKDPAPVAHVDHGVFRRALRLALEEVVTAAMASSW